MARTYSREADRASRVDRDGHISRYVGLIVPQAAPFAILTQL